MTPGGRRVMHLSAVVVLFLGMLTHFLFCFVWSRCWLALLPDGCGGYLLVCRDVYVVFVGSLVWDVFCGLGGVRGRG